MPKPEVWFAIPSANLELCRRNLPAWRDRGYKVAVLQDVVRGEVPADVVVECDAYPGWPATVNKLCREMIPASAPIVVSGGDDMLPDPNHTAKELAEQFLERFPDGFGVMQPHGDEYKGTANYCGSPWLGRGWIERMYGGSGGMFGGYMHHWADEELYWVSRCLHALWVRPDLSQYHDHFSRRGEETPDYWKNTVLKNDKADTLLFMARSAHRFPGHEPVGGGRPFDAALFRSEFKDRARRHWDLNYSPIDLPGVDVRLMGEALERCAREGKSRVAIYGAGAHTRRVGEALCDPPVEIVGVIDDDPDAQGRRLWNYPIISKDRARELGATAVVLSSDAHEEKLAEAAAPLARAGVEVVRLYTGDAAAGDSGGGITAVYFPAFDTSEALADQWPRLLWYLHPMLADLKEVVIPHTLEAPEPGSAPHWLDGAALEFAPAFEGKVRFVRIETDTEALGEAARADVALAWRSVDGVGVGVMGALKRVMRRPSQKVYNIDHVSHRRSCEEYLRLSEQMNPRASAELQESRAKFEEFAAGVHGDTGYVFGTGPSLVEAMTHDFSDGACIVCNSMVRNTKLLDRMNPVAIVAADPIFHAGPSAYAGEFRDALRSAIRRYGCSLLVPWRDYRVYMSNFDAGLRDRIIGIPAVNSDGPNLDLRDRFEMTSTANILTLMLLPLACTLFERVRIMGCDGRPLDENGYFWKHDPASQIVEHMEGIRRAHPSFFQIDYNEYYLQHCEKLAKWIDAAERVGRRVENLTPSHIECLRARTTDAQQVAS